MFYHSVERMDERFSAIPLLSSLWVSLVQKFDSLRRIACVPKQHGKQSPLSSAFLLPHVPYLSRSEGCCAQDIHKQHLPAWMPTPPLCAVTVWTMHALNKEKISSTWQHHHGRHHTRCVQSWHTDKTQRWACPLNQIVQATGTALSATVTSLEPLKSEKRLSNSLNNQRPTTMTPPGSNRHSKQDMVSRMMT